MIPLLQLHYFSRSVVLNPGSTLESSLRVLKAIIAGEFPRWINSEFLYLLGLEKDFRCPKSPEKMEFSTLPIEIKITAILNLRNIYRADVQPSNFALGVYFHVLKNIRYKNFPKKCWYFYLAGTLNICLACPRKSSPKSHSKVTS